VQRNSSAIRWLAVFFKKSLTNYELHGDKNMDKGETTRIKVTVEAFNHTILIPLHHINQEAEQQPGQP